MEFDEILAALAKEIGEDELVPDESGMVRLGAEGTALTIVCETVTRNVVVFSEIAEIPLSGREAFYEEALRANWLFHGGEGASLAICPETGKLALNRVWPLDVLTGETFVVALQRFLTMLCRWRELAVNYRGALEESDAARSLDESPPEDGFGPPPDEVLEDALTLSRLSMLA